ncbi:G-type lectin S-receptor-like serine/threonine-protein kinase At5g24080 [Primulina huaijiensis]|uniref:G-type lectin S-receptor-like serine/threonine-protein kinase At5g24080 n=1 Tax=Primulina huaijiensis TaxID=1492673 RepID=UPI003CC7826F
MAQYSFCISFIYCVIFLGELFGSNSAGPVAPGSRLFTSQNGAWISDNRSFAFGFTPVDSMNDEFELGIWFQQLPGDRTLVWSANANNPVSEDAIFDFDRSGNLVLNDRGTAVWTSNTSNSGVETAVMSENGNFILYGTNQRIIWQSFSHPSDTLLPGQPLTVSLELKSSRSPAHGGFYTMKMLQQPNSLNLALTYNVPEGYEPSLESYANYSYWPGPNVSNVTGEVTAVLDEGGSFGIIYGSSSEGAVYVYKNENDNGTLSLARNQSSAPLVLRRLILEANGNLRIYRWDNDVNGSRQWVSEWAAVSTPCEIAGICGNGICNLGISKSNASCICLPGTFKVNNDDNCSGNSSLTGKCSPHRGNLSSLFKIETVQQTNYFYSDSSVIANYSDIESEAKCGDVCLSDCECVASVYGLNEEKPYCWLLRSLEFGGYQDPGSTLFVKVEPNGSSTTDVGTDSPRGLSNKKKKTLVLPIVLSITVMIVLLYCLLYTIVRRKRTLKKALDTSLILSGGPVGFSYRDLQSRTANFSELLGTGGFGSVYKGSLSDGTPVAVKKLDKILPHGEKEFITEVNTIGSMYHMNLVRLRGYCSEGKQRLLVYEFMKNGSLDKWIFHSHNFRETQDRLLDWPTRYQVAIGTAKGIAYFHEQCRDRIIHCDIKPENILLDEDFCPKVSDFGLAKLMGREHSHVVTMVRGTRGYLAPEWVSNRPITVKADVYSYGMLLLEIIGGRRNLDMSLDVDDFFYPGWAFKAITNGTPLKVADRRLEGSVEEEELVRALKIAFWCIQDEINMRPTMGEVVTMLEGSIHVNMPPMPHAVSELLEEGLDHVHRAMRRELNQGSSFTTATTTTITTTTTHPSSRATCSHSTFSPR